MSPTQDYAAALARYTKSGGKITYCPTACVGKTSASAPPADRMALWARFLEREGKLDKVSRPIRGQPYVPDPDTLTAAKLLCSESTGPAQEAAADAVRKIIQENNERGASFGVIAENLNLWEIPHPSGDGWNRDRARKFPLKNRKAQV